MVWSRERAIFHGSIRANPTPAPLLIISHPFRSFSHRRKPPSHSCSVHHCCLSIPFPIQYRPEVQSGGCLMRNLSCLLYVATTNFQTLSTPYSHSLFLSVCYFFLPLNSLLNPILLDCSRFLQAILSISLESSRNKKSLAYFQALRQCSDYPVDSTVNETPFANNVAKPDN